MFIEHVLDRTSSVLLITRPYRTGKSLNLDTLRTFLDSSVRSTDLFKGLYIETSLVWGEINSYPVLYFDFKDLTLENYEQQFRDMILKLIEKYLDVNNLEDIMGRYHSSYDLSVFSLRNLSEAIYNHCNVKPYIIIDSYDSLFLNSADTEKYNEFEKWLGSVLSPALKGNEFLEKAVLSGVTHIALDRLFDGSSNVAVYDVFTPSKFDNDFGLTEEEVIELVPDIYEREKVKEWYYGTRFGNSQVYNIYSVLSHLSFHKFKNYWGTKEVMARFKKLFSPVRQKKFVNLLKGEHIPAEVESRLSYDDLISMDKERTLLGLAIQMGYLTYHGYQSSRCNLYLSGLELREAWKNFILDTICSSSGTSFLDAVNSLPDFSGLGKIVSNYFSLYKLDFNAPEKDYPLTVFFLFYALGFKVKLNFESSYEIMLELPESTIIFGFKAAQGDISYLLELSAELALTYIDEKKYCYDYNYDLPLYKVGIGFSGKHCYSMSVLDESNKSHIEL
jgi:hypothetical protein